MNPAEYKTMFDLETFYWWFVARRKLLADTVSGLLKNAQNPLLLDVGCGTGSNYDLLSKFGSVVGADSSQQAITFGKARGAENLVLSDAENLQFANETFDLVTALDVLEHTDNDIKALSEMWRVLRPGGQLVITVPAFGFLWSEHDEALHHRRRYTVHELRNKLSNTGFLPQRSTYFITLLFLPILIMRFLQNLRKTCVEPKTSHVILPGWLNGLLVKLLDLERICLRYFNLPIGVTVVAIAQKPQAAKQQFPMEPIVRTRAAASAGC